MGDLRVLNNGIYEKFLHGRNTDMGTFFIVFREAIRKRFLILVGNWTRTPVLCGLGATVKLPQHVLINRQKKLNSERTV